MPIAQFIKLIFELGAKFPQFLKYVPMLIKMYPLIKKFLDDITCAVGNRCPNSPTVAKDIVKGRVRYALKNSDSLLNFVDSLRELLRK
jgi:hypothetical protein